MSINALESSGFSERYCFLLMALKLFRTQAEELRLSTGSRKWGGGFALGQDMATCTTLVEVGGRKLLSRAVGLPWLPCVIVNGGWQDR